MKYDPKTECDVLLGLHEIGEATTTELQEFLQKQMKVNVESELLVRYLRRWKAKKVIAGNYHNGKLVWKMADIPPWYISGIMAIVKGAITDDMRDAMDGLNEKLKDNQRLIEPRSVWGTYKFFHVTFKAVDPILGGRLSKEDGHLILPNHNGKRFIPSSWIRAWIGNNAALRNLPHSIKYRLAVTNGDLPDFKTEHYRLKVRTGIASYEAIPSGTQWTHRIGFPMRGTRMRTKEDWQQFLEFVCEGPLRGLGANPFALGGRVELVEMKEII